MLDERFQFNTTLYNIYIGKPKIDPPHFFAIQNLFKSVSLNIFKAQNLKLDEYDYIYYVM